MFQIKLKTMKFIEHNSERTFLVEKLTGLGVIESPIKHDSYIIPQTSTGHTREDNLETAQFYAEALNDSYKAIVGRTDWLDVYYRVVVNKSTPKGNELYQEFVKDFQEKWDEAISMPQNFTVYEMENGVKVAVQYDENLD